MNFRHCEDAERSEGDEANQPERRGRNIGFLRRRRGALGCFPLRFARGRNDGEFFCQVVSPQTSRILLPPHIIVQCENYFSTEAGQWALSQIKETSEKSGIGKTLIGTREFEEEGRIVSIDPDKFQRNLVLRIDPRFFSGGKLYYETEDEAEGSTGATVNGRKKSWGEFDFNQVMDHECRHIYKYGPGAIERRGNEDVFANAAAVDKEEGEIVDFLNKAGLSKPPRLGYEVEVVFQVGDKWLPLGEFDKTKHFVAGGEWRELPADLQKILDFPGALSFESVAAINTFFSGDEGKKRFELVQEAIKIVNDPVGTIRVIENRSKPAGVHMSNHSPCFMININTDDHSEDREQQIAKAFLKIIAEVENKSKPMYEKNDNRGADAGPVLLPDEKKLGAAATETMAEVFAAFQEWRDHPERATAPKEYGGGFAVARSTAPPDQETGRNA